MSWTPLASSGIAYQFLHYDAASSGDVPGLPENVSFDSGTSRVSLAPPGAPVGSDSSWTLHLLDVDSVRLRVTAYGFSSDADVEGEYWAAYFEYPVPSFTEYIENTATAVGGVVGAFIPSPFEIETTKSPAGNEPAKVEYTSSSYFDGVAEVGLDYSWSFGIEVWVDGPEPPVGRVNPDANERTYTASQSADTALTTWIRGVDGRANLASIPLEVVVSPYPRGHERLTVPATGDALGKVEWGITTEQAKKIGQGLYKIIIRRADKGELLHRGTLEIAA